MTRPTNSLLPYFRGHSARLLLGGVLVFYALSKAVGPASNSCQTLGESFGFSGLVSAHLLSGITWLELLVGTGLLFLQWMELNIRIAITLMSCFVGLVLALYFAGHVTARCGCFGDLLVGPQDTRLILVRNLILLGAGICVSRDISYLSPRSRVHLGDCE